MDELLYMHSYFDGYSDYYIATVQELKVLLKSNGLSVNGPKEYLIHRLQYNNIKCNIGYLAYSEEELREIAEKRKLDTKGNKYTLIRRLKKNDKNKKPPEVLFVDKESTSVFTGVLDVDRQILLAIDDESLLRVCMVNKYMIDFMYDEVFWNLRIDERYGGVDMYKYKGKSTYKTIYTELSKRNKYIDRQLSYVAKNGYLPIFKYLTERRETYYNDHILMNALKNGKSELGLYIIQIGKKNDYNYGSRKLPEINDIVSLIIEKGYIEIVKYIVENRSDIMENIDDKYLFRCATGAGRLEIVKYLEGKFKYSEEDYKYAFKTLTYFQREKRYVEMVTYLFDRGGNRKSYDYYIVSNTLKKGKGDVRRIKRLYEESEDPESMKYAIFDWIEKYRERYELENLVYTEEYHKRDINAVIIWAMKTGKVDWSNGREWE